jgi:hypothetical protein
VFSLVEADPVPRKKSLRKGLMLDVMANRNEHNGPGTMAIGALIRFCADQDTANSERVSLNLDHIRML